MIISMLDVQLLCVFMLAVIQAVYLFQFNKSLRDFLSFVVCSYDPQGAPSKAFEWHHKAVVVCVLLLFGSTFTSVFVLVVLMHEH